MTTRAGHAAADTWFLNFYGEGDQCLGMPGGKCLEQSLGAVPTFPVFYGGDGDPIVDFLGVYALRFEELTPVHDGLPVPPEAFLGAVVTLRLARVTGNDDGWPLTNFDVYRMAPTAMPWSEGDNEVMKTCGLGEASYSCKSCGENMQEPWTCNEPWPESMFPFVKNDMNKVLTVEFAKTMKTEEDLALPFKGPIADWDWLLGSGMLLAPQELAETEIEVRAREYAEEAVRTFISVVHCPFKEG